jgi:ribosomal-protein-alanine N-acetyltransferase
LNADIDISSVVLKTERLILRPWKLTDLDDFYEYASVDGVGQMAGWLPHENKEASLEILKTFIEGRKTFALECKGKAIGSLGIDKYKESEAPEFDALACREIGYVLSRDYWGRGLMAEAVSEVIRWLFEDIGLDLVLCGHFLKNRQSARVQEKCGFTFYHQRVYETRYGTAEDSCLNILRREDWTAGKGRQGTVC